MLLRQEQRIDYIIPGLPIMSDLDTELAAYDKMRDELEAHSMGKWVVVRDGQLVGTFNDVLMKLQPLLLENSEGALTSSAKLVPLQSVLPASVAYRLDYGSDKVRV